MQELCKSLLRNLKKPFLVFFLILILISSIVLGWIGGEGDATCNTISCNLSDDEGYLFTELDFIGTTGLSDGIDNTANMVNDTDVNYTNAYFNLVQIYSTFTCTNCVDDTNINFSNVTFADLTDDVGLQVYQI